MRTIEQMTELERAALRDLANKHGLRVGALDALAEAYHLGFTVGARVEREAGECLPGGGDVNIKLNELNKEVATLKSEVERVIAAFEQRTGLLPEVHRNVLSDGAALSGCPVRVEVRVL